MKNQERKCGTCTHWLMDNTVGMVSPMGTCRREPPQVFAIQLESDAPSQVVPRGMLGLKTKQIEIQMPKRVEIQIRSAFPSTSEDDPGCSKYENATH